MADVTRKLRPFALATWQRERDRERLRGMPALLARKEARMSASPFAVLGGLTAAAHRRGARAKLELLEENQGRRLLRNAVELAGLHEAVALAHAAERVRSRA